MKVFPLSAFIFGLKANRWLIIKQIGNLLAKAKINRESENIVTCCVQLSVYIFPNEQIRKVQVTLMCKIHLLLLALEGKIKLLTQANSIVDNQACIVSGFYLNLSLDLSDLKTTVATSIEQQFLLKFFISYFCEFLI